MSSPNSSGSLGQFMTVLRIVFGIALGVFVIAQTLFVFGVNCCDFSSTARDWLERHRTAWIGQQRGEAPDPRGGSPKTWGVLVKVPGVGTLLDEWVDKGSESRLGKVKREVSSRLDHWGWLSGQAQGWKLFAPDTWRLTCLVHVELKWTDDEEPDEKPLPDGVPEKVLFYSDNDPGDITSFFRAGHFRMRRYESNFEMDLRRKPDEKEHDWQFRLEQRVRDRIFGDTDRGEQEEILIYLRWRMRRYLERHPEMPMPKQVILHTRNWTIPPPPGPHPWMWQDEIDIPLCRFRPWRHLETTEARYALELYLHSQGQFEDKKPTRWELTHFPAKPASSD